MKTISVFDELTMCIVIHNYSIAPYSRSCGCPDNATPTVCPTTCKNRRSTKRWNVQVSTCILPEMPVTIILSVLVYFLR